MAISYGTTISYFAEFGGPYSGGGGTAKITSVSLPVAEWKGANSPYSQEVAVTGISATSKIDMQADASQLAALLKTRTILYIENDQGTATAYAIGDKPKTDLIFQVSVTEAVNV